MVNETKLGQKIRDNVFNSNPYKQLSILRKSIWALSVLNNNIESTEQEKEQAQEILNNNKEIETKINTILNNNNE